MARTEHLPIYKKSYDLCLYLEQVVRNFSRYHKYSLGQDLRDGARRALRLIVRANACREKVPVLLALREELEELKVLLRLCQDVKALSLGGEQAERATVANNYWSSATNAGNPNNAWNVNFNNGNANNDNKTNTNYVRAVRGGW